MVKLRHRVIGGCTAPANRRIPYSDTIDGGRIDVKDVIQPIYDEINKHHGLKDQPQCNWLLSCGQRLLANKAIQLMGKPKRASWGSPSKAIICVPSYYLYPPNPITKKA